MLCPSAAPRAPTDDEDRQGLYGGVDRPQCFCSLSTRVLDPVLTSAASCMATLLATPLGLVPATALLLLQNPGTIRPAVLWNAQARLRCAIRALRADTAEDRPQLGTGPEGRAGREARGQGPGLGVGRSTQENGGGQEAGDEDGCDDTDTDSEGEDEDREDEDAEGEEEEGEDWHGCAGPADDKGKLLNDLSCTLTWVGMLSHVGMLSPAEEGSVSSVSGNREPAGCSAGRPENCPCEARTQEADGSGGALGSSDRDHSSTSADHSLTSADRALDALQRLLCVHEALALQFLEASWEREAVVFRRGEPSGSACPDRSPGAGPGCQSCPTGRPLRAGPGPWEVMQGARPGNSCSFPALLGSVPGLRSPEDVLLRLIPACVGCPVGPALETHPLVALQAMAQELGELPREGRDLSLVRSGHGTRKRKREAAPCAPSGAHGSGPGSTSKDTEGAAGEEGPGEQEDPGEEKPVQESLPFLTSASSLSFNRPSPHPRPDKVDSFLEPRGVVIPAACASAFSAGYSIAIRGLGRRLRRVGRVCRQLARLFGQASVGANLYLTPPGGKQGLAKHADDHCVFVCQLAGRKLWRVYRPAPGRQHRLPRLYSVGESSGAGAPAGPSADAGGAAGPPQGPCPAAEEAMSVCLGPGDVLYIPRGFAHHAATGPHDTTEPSAPPVPTVALGEDAQQGHEQLGEPSTRAEWQGASLHVTFGVEVEAPFE